MGVMRSSITISRYVSYIERIYPLRVFGILHELPQVAFCEI